MGDLTHWVSDNLFTILGFREKAVESYIVGMGMIHVLFLGLLTHNCS